MEKIKMQVFELIELFVVKCDERLLNIYPWGKCNNAYNQQAVKVAVP